LTFFDTVKILLSQEKTMGMNVNLTTQLEALVRSKVNSGVYTCACEVVRKALRLMDKQDRLRQVKFDALRSEVRKGLDRGASTPKSMFPHLTPATNR
jgi:antitoxin ParD1/3/4